MYNRPIAMFTIFITRIVDSEIRIMIGKIITRISIRIIFFDQITYSPIDFHAITHTSFISCTRINTSASSIGSTARTTYRIIICRIRYSRRN